MKGSKYLSELVDLTQFKTGYLNVVYAPTGSGKTYFALNHIPSHVEHPLTDIAFLIDTINGRTQIIEKYKAVDYYDGWVDGKPDGGAWYNNEDHVVVITYAKFGALSSNNPGFAKRFQYIICDELPSLIKFKNIRPIPNIHTVAFQELKWIINSNTATVIALTATPSSLYAPFDSQIHNIPIDQELIRQVETRHIEYFSDSQYLVSNLDPQERGIFYTSRITAMQQVESIATQAGIHPICIWSTANAEHPMTTEQRRVRESVLKKGEIPEEYNLLIINSSSETSIKIETDIDYIIVNSKDVSTQIQVRGRYNKDLETLYLPSAQNQVLDVPEAYLGRMLFSSDKTELCKYFHVDNGNGRICRWTTISRYLTDQGYILHDGRKNNKRYTIIEHSQ